MNRLFIALDILPKDRQLIHLQCKPVLSKLKNCRPVSPDNYHITLKFLGDTNNDKTQYLISSINDLVLPGPFPEYSVNRFGVFPNKKNPSILWAGIETDMKWTNELHKRVEDLVISHGFSRDTRRFTPHITIARLKKFSQGKLLEDFISNNTQKLFTSSFLTVTLYSSELTPNGPIYTTLAANKCKQD